MNDDLVADRATTVRRTLYEARNNALVEGVLTTHATDVVGAAGPTLQLECDDESGRAYCDIAETVFGRWFEEPDRNGRLSGPELLTLAVRVAWTRGEHLWQLTQDPAAGRREIGLRLHELDTERLCDPGGGDPDRIVCGVEHDGGGRPLGYWVGSPAGWGGVDGFEPVRLDAAAVVHDFKPLEPGQLRGYPMLGPCLPAVADLRDFDVVTLDAARAAADYAILLTATGPGMVPIVGEGIKKSVRIRRRQITPVPPGYDAKQMDPKHPVANYVEFRRERLRELGRPAAMPLLSILADASRHNYSSARLDLQNYHRANRCAAGPARPPFAAAGAVGPAP